jgi:hypothetical protein
VKTFPDIIKSGHSGPLSIDDVLNIRKIIISRLTDDTLYRDDAMKAHLDFDKLITWIEENRCFLDDYKLPE